jgi:hypothetical protein
MDYTVEQVQSLANFIEYYVRPKRDGSLYLKVDISSRDGTQVQTVWLQHIIGTGTPQQISPKEWCFYVQGEILEHGWNLVKVSIDDEVSSTFGKKGFVYQRLQSIRIRGNLAISPITLYRIEP